MERAFLSLTLSAFVFILSSNASFGASPTFCKQYANNALSQLEEAKKLGIAGGLEPPVWSSDHNSHYNWCLGNSEEVVKQGTAMRQAVLDLPYGAVKLLPKPLDIKPVQGKILAPAANEATCKAYANNAVDQQQYNLDNKCGQTGPEWKADYTYHYSWCKHGGNFKEAIKQDAIRNALLSTCTASGCPLIAPGMTLGLRRSGNKPDDPFAISTQIFDSCNLNISLTQLTTPDVDPGSFGKPPNWNRHWKWTSIVFPSTKSANQYPLPPGVVIGLSGDEFTSSTAFGIIPYHGPEKLPGGMFIKATGGDSGRGKGRGLYWYESTGKGFTDWTSVNRLPRGTIVALRHSDTQGSLSGRSESALGMLGTLANNKVQVQKIIWQGKVLDPHDSSIEPPPGFVVKRGGDLGALGHGYFWYEKTTGP